MSWRGRLKTVSIEVTFDLPSGRLSGCLLCMLAPAVNALFKADALFKVDGVDVVGHESCREQPAE